MAMAIKQSVIVTDDLDGSADAAPVSFALDGTTYEIDLSAKNLGKFEKALAPYIEHGRRVSARTRRRPVGRPRDGENAAVRAWAKSEGLKVSERGRISADIKERYEAAH